MPAKDRYHDAVVHGLQKAGWKIEAENYCVYVRKRQVYIDILAIKEAMPILVEVKVFDTVQSPINFLRDAIGQYALYQIAVEYNKTSIPIYLAIQPTAYKSILSEEIGLRAKQRFNMQLILYDEINEELLQWIV